MPIYDYKCKACEHEYEVLYKTHAAVALEEPSEECPKCGEVNKEKLVSKDTGFVLNGSGWYKKHYG